MRKVRYYGEQQTPPKYTFEISNGVFVDFMIYVDRGNSGRLFFDLDVIKDASFLIFRLAAEKDAHWGLVDIENKDNWAGSDFVDWAIVRKILRKCDTYVFLPLRVEYSIRANRKQYPSKEELERMIGSLVKKQAGELFAEMEVE